MDEMTPATTAAENFTMDAGKSPTPIVIVVDDEALIRWSLSETLTKAGYQEVEAENGNSALKYFQNGRREIDMGT